MEESIWVIIAFVFASYNTWSLALSLKDLQRTGDYSMSNVFVITMQIVFGPILLGLIYNLPIVQAY